MSSSGIPTPVRRRSQSTCPNCSRGSGASETGSGEQDRPMQRAVRYLSLLPSLRRRQEHLDGERIGNILPRAPAVGSGPETHPLQACVLGGLPFERSTIHGALAAIKQVVRLRGAIEARRTERRKCGIRVVQDTLEELIVCCACRNQIAGKVDA